MIQHLFNFGLKNSFWFKKKKKNVHDHLQNVDLQKEYEYFYIEVIPMKDKRFEL